MYSSWQVVALTQLDLHPSEFCGELEVQYVQLVSLVLVSNILELSGNSLKFLKKLTKNSIASMVVIK